MNQFLKKIFFSTFLLFVFLIFFGHFQNYFFRKGSYFKSQWINKVNDQSFDVIIIGNSRGALFEFDPEKFKYINLSEDGSGLKTTFTQLYLFYKNNNNTKKIILEGDIYSLRKIDDSKRSPRWIPYFHDINIYNTLKNEHQIFKYYKILPAIVYSNFKFDWSFISLLNNIFNINKSPWGQYGFMYTCRDYKDEAPKGRDDYDILEPNWFWIDKIIKLANENNSTLKIVTTPYYTFEKTTDKKDIFLKEIDKRNITYIDHSKVFLNQTELFLDNRHLNCKGVKKYFKNYTNLILK